MSNKRKVIAVDGDEIFLRILENTFHSNGYDFLGIPSGKEALGVQMVKCIESGVSLLMLERRLPDMDGIRVLDFLFKKYQRRLPLVVISTLSSDKDMVESFRHGAVHHLCKPVALKVLLEQMHALILWQEERAQK